MEKFILTEIWIYPVKSLAGIPLNEANAQQRGIEHDRRWMIVDENNRFISQREFAEMALIMPLLIIENGFLKSINFTHKRKRIAPFVLINPTVTNKKVHEVTVWDDTVWAAEINDEVNEWLSNRLGTTCKLVYMTDDINRKIESKYAITGNEITSFSDGYPYLIIGEESLKLLNSKLEQPVSMARFRPNLVFAGGQAHDEDAWHSFQINEVHFVGVKNCARCPIPNIDPETSLKCKEPIKTLASYNTRNNKVYFGQNLLIENTGKIKVGDIISLNPKSV
jgi:uncharacterized protein